MLVLVNLVTFLNVGLERERRQLSLGILSSRLLANLIRLHLWHFKSVNSVILIRVFNKAGDEAACLFKLVFCCLGHFIYVGLRLSNVMLFLLR